MTTEVFIIRSHIIVHFSVKMLNLRPTWQFMELYSAYGIVFVFLIILHTSHVAYIITY